MELSSEELSVTRQCELLSMSRSTFYYQTKPISAMDLELMHRISEQYLKQPASGTRTMRDYLRGLGYKVNRKRVQRLMRIMGICAVYPKPRTSAPYPGHRICPICSRG
ncbi:MAG: transposase [Desulfatibacillum sp.]|nr:transposase [Desulfatibacillum sp.]